VPALLVTGPPGCGKTTLVLETVRELGAPAGGFYTEELRRAGRRVGFRLVTLDGRAAVLACTQSRSPLRVARYGVELAAVDDLGVPALLGAARRGWLVVVDEIGKMELLSPLFRRALLDVLDGGWLVFGSIMLARHPFADAIKSRPDVVVLPMTRQTRAEVRERVLRELRAAIGRD